MGQIATGPANERQFFDTLLNKAKQQIGVIWFDTITIQENVKIIENLSWIGYRCMGLQKSSRIQKPLMCTIWWWKKTVFFGLDFVANWPTSSIYIFLLWQNNKCEKAAAAIVYCSEYFSRFYFLGFWKYSFSVFET